MKRGRKAIPNQRRREIKAEPGSHVDVARKFGVSPAYVCMLKRGYRPLQFTDVEVMGATLTTMAITGEAA